MDSSTLNVRKSYCVVCRRQCDSMNWLFLGRTNKYTIFSFLRTNQNITKHICFSALQLGDRWRIRSPDDERLQPHSAEAMLSTPQEVSGQKQCGGRSSYARFDTWSGDEGNALLGYSTSSRAADVYLAWTAAFESTMPDISCPLLLVLHQKWLRSCIYWNISSKFTTKQEFL